MKKRVYDSPKVELIEIETEGIIADSWGDNIPPTGGDTTQKPATKVNQRTNWTTSFGDK